MIKKKFANLMKIQDKTQNFQVSIEVTLLKKQEKIIWFWIKRINKNKWKINKILSCATDFKLTVTISCEIINAVVGCTN